jgi:hypothetical protein
MIEIPDHLSQALARGIASELRDASNAFSYDDRTNGCASVINQANLLDAFRLSQLPIVRNHPHVKRAIGYATPSLRELRLV